MRLAIISDIHSNLEALEAVFSDIDRRSPDLIVCLGDLVGYGANPVECLEMVRSRTSLIILGNHDAAAYSVAQREHFNSYALSAIEWTSDQLSEEDKQFLKALPLSIVVGDSLFVHATPRNPEVWDYITHGIDARQYFAHFSQRICFVGHTHVPRIFLENPFKHGYDPFERMIINPGSVGQPRDGDWRSSYGFLDTVAGTYDNFRLHYDVERQQKRILSKKLPAKLASRLSEGR